MNSRQKGKRGELELSHKLNELGFETRRGQQDGKFKPLGNIFLTDGDCIYCFTIHGELLFFTDLENAGKIINLHWCKIAKGYSATHIGGKQVAAHRVIAGVKGKDIVDHKNRDKRDNRTCNLRICNKSENAYNSKIRADNTSGHTGVSYRKDTGKWTAEIKHNYRKIYLGSFVTKEGAVAAREKAEKKYAKEYRRMDS